MDSALPNLVTSLVLNGTFGHVELIDLKLEDRPPDIGYQLASQVYFVSLKLKEETGKEETLPLVIKVQLEDEQTRKAYQTHVYFHNEFTMYKDIIPALGFDQCSFPRLYHAHVSEQQPGKDLFIFENLRCKQFRNSKDKLFLDFDHISLSVKKIAEFHSLSYILKHEDPRKFHELCGQLKKRTVLEEEDEKFEIGQLVSIERGVRAFERAWCLDGEESVEELLIAVRRPLLARHILCLAEEPFGVICHGDFCNNNVMYRYGEGGTPELCALVDFQMARYGTPALDLAYFLYMHTDERGREKFWDYYLSLYWRTLRGCVPSHIELPPFHDFLEHFSSRAVYGYMIACFFIPMMMVGNIKWAVVSAEEKIRRNKTLGGEEAEHKISHIFAHLYARNYIVPFLSYAKSQKLL